MEMMETDPGDQIEKDMEYINSFGYKIVQNMASERKLPANLKKMDMARLIALHNAGARVELHHLLNDLKETRSRTRRLALTHSSAPTSVPGYGTTTAEADSASASPEQEDDDDDEYTFDDDDEDDFSGNSKKIQRLARVGPPQPRPTRVRRCSYGYDMASPSPPPTSSGNQAQGMPPAPSAPIHSSVMPGGVGPGNIGGPGPRAGQPGPPGVPLLGQGQEETPKPKKPTYRRPSGGSNNTFVTHNKRVSKVGRVIKPRRDGSFVYPKMTHFQNSLSYATAHPPSPSFGQNGPGEGSGYDLPHIPSATGVFRPAGSYSPSVASESTLNSSTSLKSWPTPGVVQTPLPSPHPTPTLYGRSSNPSGPNSQQCSIVPSGTQGYTQPSPYSHTLSGFGNAAQSQCIPKQPQKTNYVNYASTMQKVDFKKTNTGNSSLPYPNNYFQKGSDFPFLPNVDNSSPRHGGTNYVDNNLGNSYLFSPAVSPFDGKGVPYAQMANTYSRDHAAPELMNSQVVKPIPLLLPVMSSRNCTPSTYITGNLECLYNVNSEHLQMPLQLSPYWKPAKTNSVNSYKSTPICFTSSSPRLYQETNHISNPMISSGPCYEESPFQPRPNFGLAPPPTHDYASNLSYEVMPNFQSQNQSKQFLSSSQFSNQGSSPYEIPLQNISTYEEPLQYQQSALCSNMEQYSSSPSVHHSYQNPNAWASSEQQVSQTWSHERDVQPHQQTVRKHPKSLPPPMHPKQLLHRKRPTQSHMYPQQTVARHGNAHVQERRGAYQTIQHDHNLSSLAKQETDKFVSVNHTNQLNEAQKHKRNSFISQHPNQQNSPSYVPPDPQKPSPTTLPIIQKQGPPPKKPCYQSSKNTSQDTSIIGHSSKFPTPIKEVQSLPVSSSSERPPLPFSEFRGQNNQLSFPLIYDYLTSTEKQLSSPKETHQPEYDLNGNISSSFIEDVVLPTLSQHGLNSKLQELVYQHGDELVLSQNSNVLQPDKFSSERKGQTFAGSEDYSLQRANQSLQVHQVSSLLSKPGMPNVSPDSSEQQSIEMSSIGLHFEQNKKVYPELSSLHSNVNVGNCVNSSYVELLPVPFESGHGEESESQALRVAKAVTDLSLPQETYREGISLPVPKQIDITLEKVMNKDENTKQVVFECSDGTGEPEYMTLDVSQEDVLDTTVGSLPGTIPASPCTSDVGDLNLLDSLEEKEKNSFQFCSQDSTHISQVSTIPVTLSDVSTETASSISDYLSNHSPSHVTTETEYLSTRSLSSRNGGNENQRDSNNLSSPMITDDADEPIGIPGVVQESISQGNELSSLAASSTSAVQHFESAKSEDNVVPSISGPMILSQNSKSNQCQVPVIEKGNDMSEDYASGLRNVPSASDYLGCRNTSVPENELETASPDINNLSIEVPELLKIIKTETVDVTDDQVVSEIQTTVESQNNDLMSAQNEQSLALNAGCVNSSPDLCTESMAEDEPVDLSRDETSPILEIESCKSLALESEENTCEESSENGQRSTGLAAKDTDENTDLLSGKPFDSASVSDDKPPESDLKEDSVHQVCSVLRSKSAGKTYPGKQVRQPVRCSPRTSGRPSPSYASPSTSALPLFRSESPVHQTTRGRKPCPNEDNGCPLELTSAQLSSHLLVCEYNFIDCPAIGCEWNGIVKKLSTHIRENHRPAIGAGTDSRHTVSVHQIHQQQHLTFLREVSRKLFVVCIHAFGNDIYASIQYIASGRAEKPITATGTLEVIDFVGTPHAWRGMIGPIQQGLKFLRESGNCLQVTSQCLGAIPDNTITFHTNIRVNHSQHSATSSNSDPIS